MRKTLLIVFSLFYFFNLEAQVEFTGANYRNDFLGNSNPFVVNNDQRWDTANGKNVTITQNNELSIALNPSGSFQEITNEFSSPISISANPILSLRAKANYNNAYVSITLEDDQGRETKVSNSTIVLLPNSGDYNIYIINFSKLGGGSPFADLSKIKIIRFMLVSDIYGATSNSVVGTIMLDDLKLGYSIASGTTVTAKTYENTFEGTTLNTAEQQLFVNVATDDQVSLSQNNELIINFNNSSPASGTTIVNDLTNAIDISGQKTLSFDIRTDILANTTTSGVRLEISLADVDIGRTDAFIVTVTSTVQHIVIDFTAIPGDVDFTKIENIIILASGSATDLPYTGNVYIDNIRLGISATTPSILASGIYLNPFTSTVGVASAAQKFTISGSSLSNGIIITAPSNFEVSTSPGSDFTTTVTVSPAAGSINSTNIYVRYNPTSEGYQTGNITLSSSGAITKNISVEGSASLITKTNSADISGSFAVIPNPASDAVVLSYSMEKAVPISIQICDFTGKEILMVDPTSTATGSYLQTINLSEFISGIYFVKFLVGTELVRTEKMVVMK